MAGWDVPVAGLKQNPRARRCRRSPGQPPSDRRTDRRLHQGRHDNFFEPGEGDILLADRVTTAMPSGPRPPSGKAWANISPKTNRKGSFVFSRWVYRQRNLVERFFNRNPILRAPRKLPAAGRLVATRIWCQSLWVDGPARPPNPNSAANGPERLVVHRRSIKDNGLDIGFRLTKIGITFG